MTTYSISRHKMRVLFFVLLVSAFILPLSSADTDVVREADADNLIPVDHIIILDNSGSISTYNNNILVSFAKEYVNQTATSTPSGYTNYYSVISYNNVPTVRCIRYSSLEMVHSSLSNVTSPQGSSSPSKALQVAHNITQDIIGSGVYGVTNVILICEVNDLGAEWDGVSPSGANTSTNCLQWIDSMVGYGFVNVRVVSIGTNPSNASKT